MILHDRVVLSWPVPFDPPQHDQDGDELFDITEVTVAAEVVALPSNEVLSEDRVNVITRYRIVLAPGVNLPQSLGDGATVTWRGVAYGVDGAVERHVLRGRLHHYELISQRVT